MEVTPKGAQRSGAPRSCAVDGTSTALHSNPRDRTAALRGYCPAMSLTTGGESPRRRSEAANGSFSTEDARRPLAKRCLNARSNWSCKSGARCARAALPPDYELRNDLNDARISETKIAGCSQAAKWVPLGNLL